LSLASATTEAGESFTEDLSIEVSNPLATLEMPVSGGDPGFNGYYYGIHRNDGSLIKGGSIALVQPELADSLTLNITAENSYGFDASTSLTPGYDQEGTDYTFPATEGTNQYYVMESYQASDRAYQYGTVQDGNTQEVATLTGTTTEKSITAPEEVNINLSTAYAYNSDIREALRVEKNFIAANPMNFDLPVNEFSPFFIVGNFIPPSNTKGLEGVLTIRHQSEIPSQLSSSTGTAQANTTGNKLSGTVDLGDAIPNNVYSTKAFLFNPLISNSSEYGSLLFDVNAKRKRDHVFPFY